MKSIGDNASGSKRSLRVHSVLYGNDPAHVLQAIQHLNRAADHAIAAGDFDEVSLVYGDCSPTPAFSDDVIEEIRTTCRALSAIECRFFDANLGSAAGHNRLLADAQEEFILIMNPDVMLAPNALVELMRPYQAKGVGMVEARQLPIEHPKEYDLKTGETSWAATACALIPLQVLTELKGFDHETFFLYCDDVDFSWRVRLSGRKVLYQSSAVVFHDKRLGQGGAWVPGEAEKYYSAEAALLLAWKYSRPDLVAAILRNFRNSPEPHFQRAANEFDSRQDENRLPSPIDPNHRVAMFVDGYYAKHRFVM